MTPAEVARVLAVAAAADPRHRTTDPAEASRRVEVWAAVLHPDMPLEWAAQAVLAHYAARTEALVPADLNHRFKAHRGAQASAASAAERRAAVGVPMPDYVRAAYRSLPRRA